jgi:hypothetical protein
MGYGKLHMVELKNRRQTHQKGGRTPDEMSASSLAWLCLLPVPGAASLLAFIVEYYAHQNLKRVLTQVRPLLCF